jgi:putative phosphoesterase
MCCAGGDSLMRIGIVSDIHCNFKGLQRGLEMMGTIDQLWCAGDSVFQFRWSNEVVEYLRDSGARVVLGNHEESILSQDGVRALSGEHIRQDLVEWMRSQPYRIEEVVDGKKVMMTHGSPWDPWRDYHYPHESIWKRADELGHDTIIVGHTHFKMAERFGNTLVINPGSAGDARDSRNEFQLSVAVWDTTSGEVIFYDYQDPQRSPAAPAVQA